VTDGCLVCKRPLAHKSINAAQGLLLVPCGYCGAYVTTDGTVADTTLEKFPDATSWHIRHLVIDDPKRTPLLLWGPAADRIPNNLRPVDLRELQKRQEPSVSERMDSALLNISKYAPKLGEQTRVDLNPGGEGLSLLWTGDVSGASWMLNALSRVDWITSSLDTAGARVAITPRGWQRVEELRRGRIVSGPPTAFVAMWFSSGGIIDRVYEEAIEPAIRSMDYKAEMLGKTTTLQTINDEIFAQVRRARFLVVDLTSDDDGHRGSVYFEAGLAMGMKKEVIFTARKDMFPPDGAKDAEEEVRRRSAKSIAFDLSAYQILKWDENDLESFRKALALRIEAHFGRAEKPRLGEAAG
jgi:hypothetical protein